MIYMSITKLPEGGFVVFGDDFHMVNRERTPMFACTTIAAALAFISSKMAPEEKAK